MHHKTWGAAFFAGRAAEVEHRGHAMLEELRTFAEAPENVLHSLDFPETLLQSCFG